jgi:Pyruvate/2-oxoacid:ferredoxin oxidoreductase delta subunit
MHTTLARASRSRQITYHEMLCALSCKDEECLRGSPGEEAEMGKSALDMLRGVQCSGCGVCFVRAHGFPVLCEYCWDRGVRRADRIRLAVENEARAQPEGRRARP